MRLYEVDEAAEINQCPCCGIKYRDFRTGETFSSIRSQFWVCDEDPKKWHPKRRGSVLGRWRQVKLEMWALHISTCDVPF